MKKRFIDTNRWKKRWFRRLSPQYKILWLYVWDTCGEDGTWDAFWKEMPTTVRHGVRKKEAEKLFKSQIEIDRVSKDWFIPGFAKFQWRARREWQKKNGKKIY